MKNVCVCVCLLALLKPTNHAHVGCMNVKKKYCVKYFFVD